ncbi:hypothetical protein ACFSSA_15195 [Luteolibacter algae]|uniref:Uncharacterized protein n=1 Tax=Luteolibacter algae TaxID=454151 RepID=A0ABW5DF92_9BACT
MKSPFPYLLAAMVLVSPTLKAELPALDEKPWFGYFIGVSERKFQFGITDKGEAILQPLNSRGEILSLFNPIKFDIEILEATPNGKDVSKQIISGSLESDSPATLDPSKPIVYRGKVTGDAAFQVAFLPERGGFSVTGKITDNGSLKNPLRFSIALRFDPYAKTKLDSPKKEEEHEKKIKRDTLSFTTKGGEREKFKLTESVSLSEKFPDGCSELSFEAEGYDGTEFTVAASGESKIVLESKSTEALWHGIELRWEMSAAADPATEKLIFTAK